MHGQTTIAAAGLDPDLSLHVNLFPSTLIDIPVQHLVEAFPSESRLGSYCIELNEQQIIGNPSYLLGPVTALREAGLCGEGVSTAQRLLEELQAWAANLQEDGRQNPDYRRAD